MMRSPKGRGITVMPAKGFWRDGPDINTGGPRLTGFGGKTRAGGGLSDRRAPAVWKIRRTALWLARQSPAHVKPAPRPEARGNHRLNALTGAGCRRDSIPADFCVLPSVPSLLSVGKRPARDFARSSHSPDSEPSSHASPKVFAPSTDCQAETILREAEDDACLHARGVVVPRAPRLVRAFAPTLCRSAYARPSTTCRRSPKRSNFEASRRVTRDDERAAPPRA